MPVSSNTREKQSAQPREGKSSQKTETAAATGRIKKISFSVRRPAGFTEAEDSASDVSALQSQPSQTRPRKLRMASMGGGHLNPEPLLRLVKSPPMLNKILASICKAEGLPSAGVKAELQNRICENIRRYVSTGDVAGFQRIKAMLEHPDQILQLQGGSRYVQGSYAPAGPSSNNMANNYNNPAHPVAYRAGPNIQFKPSPFYNMLQQLGDTKLCEGESNMAIPQSFRLKITENRQVMTQHRHTVGIQVKPVDYAILQDVQNDKKLRVMVFGCEADNMHVKHDISFPHQSEIKVNGGEIKANLRGLKNKPGSTRPVDITEFLRLRQTGYTNTIDMTYALTQKAGTQVLQKYHLMVYVVKTIPVPDLVKDLEAGKRISRESVINEMVTKARDPDIVATSTVLSLKCPLSYSRINLPCRSSLCRHTQCFDATSYLQLQEQGPTWLCPICSNPAPFENLAVDEYVRNILSTTSSSVDQVTIEPDGRWSQHSKPGSSPADNNASFGSDDEELIEIKDTRISALKMSSTPVPSAGSARTPPMSSREASSSIAPTYPSTSSKRPASQVIDLTLSDDEDNEPISRPAKRQFTGYDTPHSMIAGRSSSNGTIPPGLPYGRGGLSST